MLAAVSWSGLSLSIKLVSLGRLFNTSVSLVWHHPVFFQYLNVSCWCYSVVTFFFFFYQTVFDSSYPGDWTGWETSTREHMKMWWDLMKYLLRSLSFVIVLWQGGDSVHALFLFTVFVLFPVGLLLGFLECGWLKSQLVPTDVIFSKWIEVWSRRNWYLVWGFNII